MSKTKVRYYYVPAYAGYLRELKNLAKHGGGISREKALLADIKAGVDLSPEQIDLFYNQKYYGGNLAELKKAVNKKEKKMRQAWLRFLTASDAAGIVRTHGRDSADFPLYKRFYELLCALEADCDLRAKVHEWANTDLARIKNGVGTVSPDPKLVESKEWKELQMLSVPAIMARYDKLLQSRKGMK